MCSFLDRCSARTYLNLSWPKFPWGFSFFASHLTSSVLTLADRSRGLPGRLLCANYRDAVPAVHAMRGIWRLLVSFALRRYLALDSLGYVSVVLAAIPSVPGRAEAGGPELRESRGPALTIDRLHLQCGSRCWREVSLGASNHMYIGRQLTQRMAETPGGGDRPIDE